MKACAQSLFPSCSMMSAVYTTLGRSFVRPTPQAATSCIYPESPAGRPTPGSRKPRSAPKKPSPGSMPPDPSALILSLRRQGHEIAAIETSVHATDLYDWQPSFPCSAVLFGHEVDGLAPPLLAACDTYVRIPMLGRKHSLNVATACYVIYELLRKYRAMLEDVRIKP